MGQSRPEQPPSYPTFVGLGAAKAGTTLLHRWLEEHPQVSVPLGRKEVNFFNEFYDRGLDWYRSQFEPVSGKAVGEFSVTYLESGLVQTRIAHDLPHARCLVSLRDPVARLDSEYRDSLRLGGRSWDRRAFIAARPQALERGRYGRHLERLFDRFPRDQVKVFVFDDLVRAPDSAVRELYEFLGVDATHRPGSLRERVNPSGGARWPWIEQAAHRVNKLARRRDLRTLKRVVRSAPLQRLRALNATPDGDFPPPMPAELAAELRATYAAEIDRASKLIGRRLDGLWSTEADAHGTRRN